MGILHVTSVQAVLLAAVGGALVTAGVGVLAGAAWALIAAGVFLLVGAVLLYPASGGG